MDQGLLQEEREASAVQSESYAVNETDGLCETTAPCPDERRQKVHSKKIVCAH